MSELAFFVAVTLGLLLALAGLIGLAAGKFFVKIDKDAK